MRGSRLVVAKAGRQLTLSHTHASARYAFVWEQVSHFLVPEFRDMVARKGQLPFELTMLAKSRVIPLFLSLLTRPLYRVNLSCQVHSICMPVSFYSLHPACACLRVGSPTHAARRLHWARRSTATQSSARGGECAPVV